MHRLAPRGIHFDQILRELGVERRIGHLHLRTGVEGGNELVRMLLQRLYRASGAVLHVEFHAAAGGVSHDGGLGEGEELGTVDVRRPAVYLGDDRRDVVLVVGTLAPVLQLDDEHTAARRLTAHHAVARHVGVAFNLRNVLDAGLHLLHRLDGLVQAASRRGGDVDKDGTHVLVGHKSRLGAAHQYNEQSYSSCYPHTDEPLATEEPLHASLVFIDQLIEGSLEGMMETGREAQFLAGLLVHVGRHYQCTQGGTGGQGIEGRQSHGHGHSQTELHVERAARAAHERRRDEHRHEHERGGDDGRRDAVHSTGRSPVRRTHSLVELCLHRLHDHDGIVHHRANDQYQGK